MTRKIVDILTTTLLIIVAIFALINLVGCGTTKETKGLRVTKEMEMATKIASNYDFPVNVDIWRHDGEVMGYYVSYEQEEEFKNGSGDTITTTLTYAVAYTPDGEFIEKTCAGNYYDAMQQLNPIKP